MKLIAMSILFLGASIFSQEISLSKDSLFLAFDEDSHRSYDSVVVFNNSDETLEINDIYSTNASGFVLDIYLSDSTINSGISTKNHFFDQFSISANDSAKFIFSYPLAVPKLSSITEVWIDSIIINSNAISEPELGIKAVIDFPVGVEEDERFKSFYILRNYPNPFNPVTTIEYSLPISSKVKIIVYNFIGEKISVLENDFKIRGFHTVNFEGNNLASGIYFVKLLTKDYQKSIKVLLLK